MYDLPLKDIMTTNLITLNTNECVSEVARIFKAKSFHHIPIINNEAHLAGIISISDFERIKTGATLFRNPKVEEYNQSIFESMLVKDIMTKALTTLRPKDTIKKAYEIFKNNKFRAIPITEESKLVGILTPFDILDYFFNKTD